MEDIIERVLDRATSLGATYAEARFHGNSGTGIALKNGIFEGVSTRNEEGIGVRVMVDGALGFASTNVLDAESVDAAVEDAVRLAKLSARVRKNRISFSEEDFHRVKYEVDMRKNFTGLGIEEKKDYLKRIEESVLSAGVNVPMRYIVYEDSVEHRIYANTDGAWVDSRIPRVMVIYNLVVVENGKMAQAPFVERAFTGGLEYIDADEPWARAVEDVKVLKRMLSEGKPAPEGKLDVIIAPEVSGIAVHESVGHPYESDRIFGREAAQAGESFVTPDMLGTRIGTDEVTVIEDPTLPGSYGFYIYDDEGVKARPRYLIKDGIITEFLLNREYAHILGLHSNAAARAVNYDREPIVRMANTYLAPGDHLVEEMIEDVKHGVFIKSFNEWNIDDRRYQQRYVGREAYLIENGEIKNPVVNPIIEITTSALWSSVDAVSREIEHYPGTCGKGEPMQGVPVWMGGAYARLRGITMRR